MEIRTPNPLRPIAVVGAGTMGIGIAYVAASAGHRVFVIDSNEAALSRGQAALASQVDAAVAKGRLAPAQAESIRQTIVWTAELALAAQAGLVIEAIVEDLAVKRQLFGALARVVPFNTLLASNTSSLSISAIAGQLRLQGRVLGLHFFNPVPAMKLVEVVAGTNTDPEAIAAAIDLMRSWGKAPVQVRDVPGFIVNRVARPYYAEGFIALDEGLAPAAIDAALCEAGGFRMGPLALADLIGQDVNFAVASSVFEAGVGGARFRPQPAQQALVKQGFLGRKSGRGVYDHKAPLPQAEYIQGGASRSSLEVSDAGLLQPLVHAAREAGLSVRASADVPRGVMVVDGFRLALGDGRRLAARDDADVLIDHARDFATAATLVMTTETPEATQIAASFAHQLGRKALMVPDRAGQLVLRTLAQIANAAADTVGDQIASAQDVEIAMRLGANHPEGPLTWAQRTGKAQVGAALANIAHETGDPLYQPSAWFNDTPL